MFFTNAIAEISLSMFNHLGYISANVSILLTGVNGVDASGVLGYGLPG